jgi:predicted ATPase
VTIGALCPLLLTQRPYSNVLNKYQSLVAAEKLNFDPVQLATVEQLQHLQDRLDGYAPAASAGSQQGVFSRVSGSELWSV